MSGRHAAEAWQVTGREALELAALPSLAELVAVAPVGKPPKITGVLVSDLLRHGPGCALVADEHNAVSLVESVDDDDWRVLVLLIYAEAAAACKPAKPLDPESPAPIPVRPVTLGQRLSARYAAEHAAGLLAPLDTLAVAA